MISERAIDDFYRRVTRASSGAEKAKDALGALRGKIVVIPGNVEIGRGAMGDPREAIEEIRKLKAQAENQIASDIQAVLNDLEGKTGLCAQGVDVYFAEVTGMDDDHPRYVVSGVKIDFGRI